MTAWLPVPGYEGRYDVSDDGQVRSWLKWYREPNAPLPRLLTPSPNPDSGYPQVVLYKDRRGISKAVHQLVALAFIGPRPDGQEVRHLDGDATNATRTNLAYGTSTENEADKVRRELTHCSRGHELTEQNTYRRGNRRECRRCAIDRATAWKRRNRSEAVAS